MRRRSNTSYKVIQFIIDNPKSTEDQLIEVAALCDEWTKPHIMPDYHILERIGKLPYNKLKAKIRQIVTTYNDTVRQSQKVIISKENNQKYYTINK